MLIQKDFLDILSSRKFVYIFNVKKKLDWTSKGIIDSFYESHKDLVYNSIDPEVAEEDEYEDFKTEPIEWFVDEYFSESIYELSKRNTIKSIYIISKDEFYGLHDEKTNEHKAWLDLGYTKEEYYKIFEDKELIKKLSKTFYVTNVTKLKDVAKNIERRAIDSITSFYLQIKRNDVFRKPLKISSFWRPRLDNKLHLDTEDGKLGQLLFQNKPIAIYPSVNDLEKDSFVNYLNQTDTAFEARLFMNDNGIDVETNKKKDRQWKTIEIKEESELDKQLQNLTKNEFIITPNPLYAGSSSVKFYLTKKIKTNSNKNESWTIPANGFSLSNISNYLREAGIQTSHAKDTNSFYFRTPKIEVRISDHYKDKMHISFDTETERFIYTILFKDINSSGLLLDQINTMLSLK